MLGEPDQEASARIAMMLEIQKRMAPVRPAFGDGEPGDLAQALAIITALRPRGRPVLRVIQGGRQ